MYTYYITFRIADRTLAGQTYEDRRQQLMTNARTKGGGFWAETTSFILAESELDTYSYAKRVCQGLSAAHDLVVVIDPSDDSAAYFGPIEEEEVLRSFIPKAKKLT